MNTRIYKTEKYIPKVGSPVFQVLEELDAGNGQVLQLEPRNPTAEEVAGTDDVIIARQQDLIAQLQSHLELLTTERNQLATQNSSFAESNAALLAQVAEMQATIEQLQNPPVGEVAIISAAQARIGLRRMGLRDAVEYAVSLADSDVKDWYEYATVWERDNQHLLKMAEALQQTDQQIDAFFALAATL